MILEFNSTHVKYLKKDLIFCSIFWSKNYANYAKIIVIVLTINMNNKDVILVDYKDDTLKLSINGEIVYHMDKIEKNKLIEKIEKLYANYIEEQKFKVIKNDNPFI